MNPGPEATWFLPLGGCGEIGMNLNLYGHNGRWLMVDCGITFEHQPGSPTGRPSIQMADPQFIASRRQLLDGLIITHAHEDHVGAIGHLWGHLRAPVYARAFTATIARLKMDEGGQDSRKVTTVQPWPEMVDAGPFKVGFVPVSHSIPESAGLVIDTPAGRIVHSGDFKIDHTPVVGEPFSEALWTEVAKPGVKALVCDSTNVFSPAPGRSEAGLSTEIEGFMKAATGMVVATTFASNIARLHTLAYAARKAGRQVCLLGRAMRRMIEVATEVGILSDFPPTISPEDALSLPRHEVMLLVTGSQGERRAASAQLAQGSYLGIKLKEGDTFLFSSKTIPGNERGVIRIMNQLSELGVEIHDDEGGRYHVSGHANRPDLVKLHELVNPQIVIPMHGEHRHLREHARLAEEVGRTGFLAVNGMMVDLTGERPKVAEYIETGRTYLDGSVQIGSMDGIVRDRIRMALNGHVIVNIIIDENDEPLGDPWCETMGLAETGRSKAPLVDILEADLGQFLMRAEDKTLRDDERLEKELKKIVRQVASSEIGKKPEVTIITSRLA